MSELFWWRAQAVAYIVRPNARTLQVKRLTLPKCLASKGACVSSCELLSCSHSVTSLTHLSARMHR